MKGKISIDGELCKGCKYCVLACPRGVIGMGAAFNSSGCFPAEVRKPEMCNGCAFCAQMCPEIAILVWKNNGKPASSKAHKFSRS